MKLIDVLGMALLVIVATMIFLGMAAVIMYEVRMIVRNSREIIGPRSRCCGHFPHSCSAVDPNGYHTLN